MRAYCAQRDNPDGDQQAAHAPLHHRYDPQHQDDLRERRQRVDKPVPHGFGDAVARCARQRADEGADHDGNADAQNRQHNVEPRGREDAHQQVAAEMISAEGKGGAGRLQGEIDETVGITGTQQGHENAERQDQRQDDRAPAALGVELPPETAQFKLAQTAGGRNKRVPQSP